MTNNTAVQGGGFVMVGGGGGSKNRRAVTQALTGNRVVTCGEAVHCILGLS